MLDLWGAWLTSSCRAAVSKGEGKDGVGVCMMSLCPSMSASVHEQAQLQQDAWCRYYLVDS